MPEIRSKRRRSSRRKLTLLPIAIAAVIVGLGVSYFLSLKPVKVDSRPKLLGTMRLLEEYEPLGIRESCAIRIYKMSETKAQELESQGTKFFEGFSIADVSSERNPYMGWVKGTVPKDAFALSALGCRDSETADSETRNRLYETLNSGEVVFYTLTENREGLIIVIPRLRMAAYLYFG